MATNKTKTKKAKKNIPSGIVILTLPLITQLLQSQILQVTQFLGHPPVIKGLKRFQKINTFCGTISSRRGWKKSY